MAGYNYSGLLDGGDSVGMTNEQYKGMLLDQLADLKRILGMFGKAKDTEIEDEVKAQIEKINEKLKF